MAAKVTEGRATQGWPTAARGRMRAWMAGAARMEAAPTEARVTAAWVTEGSEAAAPMGVKGTAGGATAALVSASDRATAAREVTSPAPRAPMAAMGTEARPRRVGNRSPCG